MFLGGSSDQINAMVRGAVTQAGGTVTTVVAVREPLDLAGIARRRVGHALRGAGEQGALAGPRRSCTASASSSGRELVTGGPQVDRSLLSRVRPSLLSAFDGQLGRLEGLVVVRAEPGGMSAGPGRSGRGASSRGCSPASPPRASPRSASS